MFSSSVQTADLGLGLAYLEQHLKECGYWANEERREQLSYNLSPSAYIASARQENDLERLAQAAYLAVSELNLSLCKAGSEKHLSKEAAQFLQLGNKASRGLLRPKDGETRIPPMIKVDLVQDREGSYHIAEIDTYNPRGFGFAAMLEESLRSDLKVRRFPGMEQLCRILRTTGVSSDIPWFVLVSEFERFYRAPFEVFSRSLLRRGINFPTISAHQLPSILEDDAALRCGVFAIPDTLFKEDPRIREVLLQKYQEGSLKAVYPPVAYLGSKAFLPYLRAYPGMREFIPKTTLLGRHFTHELEVSEVQKQFVLKATVSSGMKGVYFSDLDGQEYEETLKEALWNNNPAWILQEHVEQTPVPIVVFDEEGKRVTRDYYLRITAYISSSGIIDAEITGRPDRKVHGAKDCIQIPVILS